ncbi:hypothetical protein MFIFM68171_08328 [Madurella fahalii]|uniref:Heterokaryon incompatibility domain-containing protein n=1 Tax=Madurella fahalii TaxID=1157608 RepID=A0ABQ0GK28_9PEZI
MPDYAYRSLEGSSWFRVLLISPGLGDDVLRGSLVHRDLKSGGSFQALSYAWGSAEHAADLETPEGRIPLTASLASALKRLRRPGEQVALWADAVCINQGDNAEKSTQVRMMGDIYRSAELVIVDLGEEADSSDLAFELLDKVANYDFGPEDRSAVPLYLRDLDLPGAGDPGWAAIRALFRRPWFRRVWIIQEFVVAKEVMMMCGHTTSDWEILGAAVANARRGGLPYFDHQGGGGLPYYPDQGEDPARWGSQTMYSLMYLRASYQHGTRHDLVGLLKLGQPFLSTRNRDHYFAMLGLASDAADPRFDPDYDAPFDQIARRYASVYVERGRALELLYQAGGEEGSRFPSWIPDWTKPQASSSQLWYRHHGDGPSRRFFYSAGGGTVQQCHYDQENDVLSVTGVFVDTISAVGSNHSLLVDATGDLVHLKQYISDSDILMEDLSKYPTGEDLREVQWRTLIANATENEANPPKAIGDAFLALREFAWKKAELQKHRLDDVRGYIREVRDKSRPIELGIMRAMDGRTFARTADGYVGLVPFAAQPGDVVAVFSGSRVPILVRQHPSRSGLHLVIGECYLHGIMQGETISAASEMAPILLA